MNMDRRSFFAALTAAPAIAKLEDQPATKTPEPSVKLLPYQQELLDANEPEILFTGGLGSGMTFGSARWLEVGSSLWVVHSHMARENHLEQFKGFILERRHRSRIKLITLDQLERVRGVHFDRIAFDVPADYLLMNEHYLRLRYNHPGSRFLVATAPALTADGKWIIKYFSAPGRRVIHAQFPRDARSIERFASTLDAHRRWIAGEWT